MKRLSQAIVLVTLAFIVWLSAVPSASAGRYVLDQSPATLQRYFGHPLNIVTGSTPQEKTYFYAATKLQRSMPTLSKQSRFSVTFINDRATRIALNIELTKPDQSFSFDQKAAAQLYNYVFGYNPSLWKRVALPFGGGGHEGFVDNKFCYGDGVAATFISYRLGDDGIQLVYDPICEPPYSKLK